MTWADEEKSHNGEQKKPGLLPAGDKAREIVELLVAMYHATHNAECATNDDDRSKLSNCRDAGPKKDVKNKTDNGGERGADR